MGHQLLVARGNVHSLNKYPLINPIHTMGQHVGCDDLFVFIFRANSVTWNPHKLMGTLLQCSTLHIKENVSCIKLLKNSEKFLIEFLESKIRFSPERRPDGGCSSWRQSPEY